MKKRVPEYYVLKNKALFELNENVSYCEALRCVEMMKAIKKVFSFMSNLHN